MEPYVGILPSAFEAALATVEYEEGDRLPSLAEPRHISDALLSFYDTDAHFIMYYAVDEDGDLNEYTRCKKVVLSELREKEGIDLHMRVLGIDWDCPEHQHWTEELVRERESIVEYLRESDPLFGTMFAAYRSRGGYRFIFVLDRAVPVDEGERYLAGLLLHLKDLGIDADKLSDWTRLFRLPCVHREGRNTWESEFFDIQVWDRTTPLDMIRPCDRSEIMVTDEIRPVDLNAKYPTDDEVTALREYRDPAGRWKPTAVFRELKRRLKDSRCFACAFETAPMAESGNRNLTMMSYIGEAVIEAMDVEDCGPEHVYAMFHPAVMDFEQDQNWRQSLWTGVLSIWQKEQQIYKQKYRIKLEKKAKSEDDLRSIIDGMMAWDDSEALRDPETCEDHARQQMIANVGKLYFLITPDGSYSPMPLAKEQLIPAIRQSDVCELIPTKFMNKQGQMVDISVNKIINSYSIPLREIERIPQINMNGFIRHKRSHHPVLVLPMYRRNPLLRAKYHEDVDLWLRAFFGRHYEEGCRWIAYALAFEEGPTCSLSIKGAQGAGKNMFVQGLSEVLENPFMATAYDLTSQFQSGLIRSPFLWVDEGWPQSRNGLAPADMFRRVTGGGAMPVNDKFMPVQKIYNPMRIIFTANNGNVVHELSGGRDLDPADREAIAIRLTHFDIGDEATRFLSNIGGRNYTSAKGRKWIADESGDTDYILAEHMLWLYERRNDWPRGDRFLMEGNMDNLQEDQLMFEMLTRNGKTPLVIETILSLYENFDSRTGIVCEDGHLYVMISEIVNHIRDNNYAESRIRSSEVADALKNLVTCEPVPQILRSRKSQGLREWYKLDANILYKAALKFGYPMLKLMEHCEVEP